MIKSWEATGKVRNATIEFVFFIDTWSQQGHLVSCMTILYSLFAAPIFHISVLDDIVEEVCLSLVISMQLKFFIIYYSENTVTCQMDHKKNVTAHSGKLELH